MHIDKINNVFLEVKNTASFGEKLASETANIIKSIDNVLVQLHTIRTSPELLVELQGLIGDSGIDYVNSLALILHSTNVQIKELG